MSAQRTVVVTGANAGLGFRVSWKLASMGAHVVLACRSLERGAQAVGQLRAGVPCAKITVLPLDVSEPESIRQFGALFAHQVGQLDVLINNAGVFGIPLARNSAGQELQLATNYLGPFALTGTLLSCFRDGPGARIVNVGSLAHRFGTLRLEELDAGVGSGYGKWAAYARSKVALLAYTMELNRRLRRQGSKVIALGAHPGMAPTDGAKRSAAARPRSATQKWLDAKLESWIPTVEAAAEPILHAACADGVHGGDYFGPGGWLEIAGAPARARVNRRVYDVELATRLWCTSEALTGVKYLSAPVAISAFRR